MKMRDNEIFQNIMCVWIDCCPSRTGGCVGLPDDGCPVYRWFKKLILEDIADAAKKMIEK